MKNKNAYQSNSSQVTSNSKPYSIVRASARTKSGDSSQVTSNSSATGFIEKHQTNLAIAFFVAVGLIYFGISFIQHIFFGTHGFDLGIFTQAIWNYSRFHAPASNIRGVSNLLGDHFHPALVLLAPLFWLKSGPEVLLFAQAALLSLSGIPVYWYAKQKFGVPQAFGWALLYATFWGITGAVLFDFHEIALAVPVISFGCYFVLQQRYNIAFWLFMSTLLVKEDMSFLVVAFGALLLIKKQFKLGVIAAAVGTLWFFLVTRVVMPSLTGGRPYNYWSYGNIGDTPLAAAKTSIAQPLKVVQEFFAPKEKVTTMLKILLPFGMLSMFSPLIILAIPLLAERMLSTNSYYWGTTYHYTATIAPIVALAAIDGLVRIQKKYRAINTGYVITALLLLSCILSVRSIQSSNAFTELSHTLQQNISQIQSFQAITVRIPDNATVITQDSIAPHFSTRAGIYNLNQISETQSAYILINPKLSHWSLSDLEYQAFVQSTQANYQLVSQSGDWVLYFK